MIALKAPGRSLRNLDYPTPIALLLLYRALDIHLWILVDTGALTGSTAV